MGIVNVTPDSFHRRHPDPAQAIAHARQLIADGADMIDIGGESTRPGAAPVPEDEELARVIPVLRGLRDAGVPISIDTSKPAVMRAALDAGAVIVNDVSALQTSGALELVAARGAAAVLMHMKGEPATMNKAPRYDDVVDEVLEFLAARVAASVAAGIPKNRLAVDPGLGFGKNHLHNMALLAAVPRFKTLGCAVLIGASGKLPGHARLAAECGADILRIHDVKAQKRVCDECHKPGPVGGR